MLKEQRDRVVKEFRCGPQRSSCRCLGQGQGLGLGLGRVGAGVGSRESCRGGARWLARAWREMAARWVGAGDLGPAPASLPQRMPLARPSVNAASRRQAPTLPLSACPALPPPPPCCRDGTTKILISTDVLSRGFDVTQVGCC